MKYIQVHIVEDAVECHYDNMKIEPERISAVRELMQEELAAANAKAPAEEERLQKIILRLQQEQGRLLQAHYADAVPIELMKQEMERIGASITETEELIAVNAARTDGSRDALARGLALAEFIPAQYHQASALNRRRLNQGIFRQIFIGLDGQVEWVEMTDPFEAANRRLSDALIESGLPSVPGDEICGIRADAIHADLAPIRTAPTFTPVDPGPAISDPRVGLEQMISEAADLLDRARPRGVLIQPRSTRTPRG